MDMKVAKEMFEVNFFSIIHTVQAFSPLLIASRGAIVNIGSVGALYIAPFIGIYGASKAVVAQMSNCLRCKLAPFGVKVIHVRNIISHGS
jgi:1-acylglycerone phosphate reductase